MEQIQIFYLKQTSNNEVIEIGERCSLMRGVQQRLQRENKRETILVDIFVPEDDWKNGKINKSTINSYNLNNKF